jgi:hypothetical protein
MDPATRKVARQLGEVERDEGLAEDHQWPRPEDRRATHPERDGLVGEGARRHTDVAERNGEVRE